MQLRYRAAAAAVLLAMAALLSFRLNFVSDAGPAADQHLLSIPVPPGHEAAELEATVKRLAAGLAGLPELRDVQHQLPDPAALIEEVLPHFTVMLSPQELDRVGARLSSAAIAESVRRNRLTLESPQAIATKQLVQFDPFNLLPVFLQKFGGSGSGFHFDPTSSLLVPPDGSLILILAQGTQPAGDLRFAKKLMEKTRGIAGGTGAGVTGDYATAVADADAATRFAAALIVALALVIAAIVWTISRQPLRAANAALTASALELFVIGAAVLLALPIPIPRIPGNEAVERQRVLERKLGATGETEVIIVRGRTLGEAIEATASATSRLRPGSWSAATQFAPARAQQLAAIQKLRSGRSTVFSSGRIRSDFQKALTENGFRPEAYAHYMDLFEAALLLESPVPPEQFRGEALDPILQRFIRVTPAGVESRIYLHLK